MDSTLQVSSCTMAAMTAFRMVLISMFLALLGYTAVVNSQHGPGRLGAFIGNMQLMDWSGQFNLDVLLMLMLSALLMMWRHQFSGPGVMLGLAALSKGPLYQQENYGIGFCRIGLPKQSDNASVTLELNDAAVPLG
ncbi:hypothetical protein [Synechococcus sp. CS-1327]|uniref:hypothetical protein n=2 Tax=unclassified Synechococcus TaxID=2626047 RepID=UPI00223C1FE9|nr:hypothetical protein [Synechococcus sp. CS-1327]MCT0213231.1 hypothetical protein [Synechococcus sp. CS-1326]MCT0231957.1 hypothetical protein [Synechococcus sp. CS-1327]